MAKSASSARAKRPATSGRNTPSRKQVRYDFSKGVQGKYYELAMARRKIITLDEDLLDMFPDSAAVNAALWSLKELALRGLKKNKAA